MQAESRAPLGDAVLDHHVVRLLEADAVAAVVADDAAADQAGVAPEEIDAGGAAAVDDGRVLGPVSVDRKVLDAGVLDVGAGDHRKDRGGESAVAHQEVGIQGAGEGEEGVAGVEDRAADAVEVPLGLRRDVDAAADREACRVPHADRRLAEVAVGRQRGAVLAGLLEHGLRARPADGHAAAEMQGVVHQVFARSDVDLAAPQAADVIDRGLQRAVVAADDGGVAKADADPDGRPGVERALRMRPARLGGAGRPPEGEDHQHADRGSVVHRR